MLVSSRTLLAITALLLTLLQLVSANVYSQLQFIKIASPKNGETIRAGEELTIEYVMQPLVKDGVSMGRALSLSIAFHSRSGNAKQQQLATVDNKCPVDAEQSKYVTYTKKWRVPQNLKPGSYAVYFSEQVQFRRTQVKAEETIKVHLVD